MILGQSRFDLTCRLCWPFLNFSKEARHYHRSINCCLTDPNSWISPRSRGGVAAARVAIFPARGGERRSHRHHRHPPGERDNLERIICLSSPQVPSRTVFTVVENGETKSLFADTFKSSLEVVAVSDLKSTEINSHRVVYAHVQTNIPSFGVTVSDQTTI